MRFKNCKIALLLRWVALVVIITLPCIHALQVSMMASTSQNEHARPLLQPHSIRFIPPPTAPPGATDITSQLISQLAILAIKNRLKEEKEVTCDLQFQSLESLLRGRVGPVTIKGRGWRSGRNLSCRVLEATVSECELDIPKLLSHRKLLLTKPALGKMLVAMNGDDFGNFITHPLMPSLQLEGRPILFMSDGASIDPAAGTVQFMVLYNDTRWTCLLKRSLDCSKALIDVLSLPITDVNGAVVQKLSMLLGEFFNQMMWDLDGTYLSYRDFRTTDRGEAPSVMFSLNINVEKLPSPSGLDL